MTTLLIGGMGPDDPARLVQPALSAIGQGAQSVAVPGLTTYPTVEAAEKQLTDWIAELRELDREYREMDARRFRLQQRLADPELFKHPKRADAEGRYEDLVLTLNQRQARQNIVMLLIGDVYLALPCEARTALGWAPVGSRYGMRAWLESCLAVGWLPGDEVPF